MQRIERKHRPKNVKADLKVWAANQARLAKEREEAEHDVSHRDAWSFALRQRAREHRMRTSGVAQMEAFLESVEHLPRLPKDVIYSILRPLVCGIEDAVHLVGGIDEKEGDVADTDGDSTFNVGKRLCRVQGGVLTQLAPMPLPRCCAAAAHYQGEIIVLGGYDGPKASWWCSPSLLGAHGPMTPM